MEGMQRSHDKESKRARGALSCAECRRLKLKCSKTIPCSSCKRRGCSSICPNGSLITGQGTRFVLADTEKLHRKIAEMSDRIRQLEDALAVLQSTQTHEAHPLLERSLLGIKSSIDLHSAADHAENLTVVKAEEDDETQYLDAFGTLAIRDDGASTFYGRSAGSESILIGEASVEARTQNQPNVVTNGSQWNPDLPSPVVALSQSFPFAGSAGAPVDLNMLIHNHLPTYPEAVRLCELYLTQAQWYFGPVTRSQISDELLPYFYIDARSGSAELPPPQAHDLALLFILFCFGALMDVSLPPAPNNEVADRYFILTKAALTLEPVISRPPGVSTVQALCLMAIYEGLYNGENSIESTWALFGLSTKLAQSIGLHRDCARWKLSPAEVQKRRALFWELFATDCFQSLATGRLATFSLPFVDAELPSDPDAVISATDDSIQPSFPFWKAQFGHEILSSVVQGTLTSRAPKYSIILDLDRKIRDFALPQYAQGIPPEGLGLSQTMSYYMVHNYKELTLLYVHRCFFAHALNSSPDPLKSPYAPSFLAGYRSACNLIQSVNTQFSLFPINIARFWVLWTHAFSATIMLSSVVTHGTRSKVAEAALIELKSACDLFEQASVYGGRSVKFLPIVQRLLKKARDAYLKTRNGLSVVTNDIFSPVQPPEQDELSIFSGKTTTKKIMKANTASSPIQQSDAIAPTSPISPSTSESPPAIIHNPSFADAHPSLVHELHGFDRQITAQIQKAFSSSSDQEEYARMMHGLPPALQDSRARQSQQQLHRRNSQSSYNPLPSQQSHPQMHGGSQAAPSTEQSSYHHAHFNRSMQSNQNSVYQGQGHVTHESPIQQSAISPTVGQPYHTALYHHTGDLEYPQSQHPSQQQYWSQPPYVGPSMYSQHQFAADDRLQETWQQVMSNVGSPRQFG